MTTAVGSTLNRQPYKVTVVKEAAQPRRLGSWATHLVLIALVTLWLLPTLGLLVNSFRPQSAIAHGGWWASLLPPYQFTVSTYQDVINTDDLGMSFVNSLTITVPSTVIPIVLGAFAAYALACMQFRGRIVTYVLLIGLLLVPVYATVIPELRLFREFQLNGTFPGVWLAHSGYGLPFSIYLLYNFFSQLPKDLLEAAEIDGASPLRAFVRIVLPLSVPGLASLTIFQFLYVWNDLVVSLVYLGGSPDVAPVTVTTANLVSSLGGGSYKLSAAAFITMALPLLVFFSLQRYFVRGIVTGSVKG